MQNFDHNILCFEKNANFFAENWQNSQKFVIITSTTDMYKYGLAIFSLTFGGDLFYPFFS
jgi:hypothetical protein